MTGFVTIAATKGHLQIIEFLCNNHTITVNLDFRKEPMGNIQFNKHLSCAFVKGRVLPMNQLTITKKQQTRKKERNRINFES